VKVRLTRKLADRINGVDVTGRAVGDVFQLSRHDAEVLMAEGWATLYSEHLDGVNANSATGVSLSENHVTNPLSSPTKGVPASLQTRESRRSEGPRRARGASKRKES
jgi:hypothetical protein